MQGTSCHPQCLTGLQLISAARRHHSPGGVIWCDFESRAVSSRPWTNTHVIGGLRKTDLARQCIRWIHHCGGNGTGGETAPVKIFADGSLEDLLVQLGHHFSFVGFRSLPEAAPWLNRPFSSPLLAYSPIETDWTRQLDGVVSTRACPSSTNSLVPDGAARAL